MSEIDLLLDAPPCLVVNKPGGLLTQSPPGIDSLEVRLREFEKRSRRDDWQYLPWIGSPPGSSGVGRDRVCTQRTCDTATL